MMSKNSTGFSRGSIKTGYERLRRLRRGRGKGWMLESLRHALAARGIKTRGLGRPALERIYFQLSEEKKKEMLARAENRNLLRVLEQYLLWRRTRRGAGGVYSLNDVRVTRDQIIRSGDTFSIDKANALWDKIQTYEQAGFEPVLRAPRLERAYHRALDKLKTRTKLTHLETRALMRHEGKSFVQELIKKGQPLPQPRVLKR